MITSEKGRDIDMFNSLKANIDHVASITIFKDSVEIGTLVNSQQVNCQIGYTNAGTLEQPDDDLSEWGYVMYTKYGKYKMHMFYKSQCIDMGFQMKNWVLDTMFPLLKEFKCYYTEKADEYKLNCFLKKHQTITVLNMESKIHPNILDTILKTNLLEELVITINWELSEVISKNDLSNTKLCIGWDITDFEYDHIDSFGQQIEEAYLNIAEHSRCKHLDLADIGLVHDSKIIKVFEKLYDQDGPYCTQVYYEIENDRLKNELEKYVENIRFSCSTNLDSDEVGNFFNLNYTYIRETSEYTS